VLVRPLLPKTTLLFGALLLLGGCIPRPSATSAAATIGPKPATSLSGFARGINFGNALDAPTEGAWGNVLTERHFSMAAESGLDHVRVPIRFNAHALAAAPYTIDAAFFERVDWALDQAAQNNLAVMLDFHHYEELMKEPSAHAARFLGIWSQIAERYKDRPPNVVFELLNEPNTNLNANIWNDLVRDAIAIIRKTNPTRRIVIDSYFWASADWLDKLALPENDANLVASFHMYQPILFTHQGAAWMSGEYQTTGLVFPGPPASPVTPVPSAESVGWVRDWFQRYNTEPAGTNPGGPATIEAELDKASRYAAQTGRAVYMGEFGVIDRADEKSRETYIRLVRQAAERRNMAWAYWDDGGTMKAMDPKTGQWVPYLRAALFN